MGSPATMLFEESTERIITSEAKTRLRETRGHGRRKLNYNRTDKVSNHKVPYQTLSYKTQVKRKSNKPIDCLANSDMENTW